MGTVREIDFHGDRILGIEAEGAAYVYLKPIVERMGLDWSGQLQRLMRNPTLKEGMVVMPIPPEIGGVNEAVFLRLDLFHGWLFTVDASRVKAEAREPLLVYQREAYAVLARAFAPQRGKPVEVLPAPAPELPAPIAVRLVTEARMSFGTTAARELWFATGLPVVPAMRAAPRQFSMFGEG